MVSRYHHVKTQDLVAIFTLRTGNKPAPRKGLTGVSMHLGVEFLSLKKPVEMAIENGPVEIVDFPMKNG